MNAPALVWLRDSRRVEYRSSGSSYETYACLF
jgi:hypothetical protein